jgi:hypothetical protein
MSKKAGYYDRKQGRSNEKWVAAPGGELVEILDLW